MLVTLSEMKQYLRVDTASEDTLITNIINKTNSFFISFFSFFILWLSFYNIQVNTL